MRTLIVWLIAVAVGMGGEIRCGSPYSMVLDGSMEMMGVIQQEHMVLEKVRKRGGLDGRWKVTEWTIVITSPFPSSISFERDIRADMHHRGQWVKFHMSVQGNRSVMKLTDSNMYLDVYRGRIGSRDTGVWIGEIRGNRVTLQFFQPEKMKRRGFHFTPGTVPSTLLTGAVYSSRVPKSASFEIEFPENRSGKVVYDSGTEGLATIRARVRSSRNDLAGSYLWSVDPIEGVDVDIVPVRAGEVEIRLTRLPVRNDQFGKHRIEVTFRSDDNFCRGSASKEFRLFYRGAARNHPSVSQEEKSLPNWFYYWRQTPAAHPHGDRGVILKYGGTSRHIIPTIHPNTMGKCDCSDANLTACYPANTRRKLLYICDRYPQGMTTTYPLLDRSNPKRVLGWRTTRYIDTFAVSITHEYQHYLDDMRWDFYRLQFIHPELDKDQDGIPDSEEPGLKFSSGSFQTYCPFPAIHDLDGHCRGLDLGGDEEWIAYESMRTYRPGSYDRYDWACPGRQIDKSACP